MEAAARLVVGVVLLAAAAAKLRIGRELPDVLGAYGIPRALRGPGAVALVGVETVVGGLLLFGVASDEAAYAAVALAAIFVVAALSVRLRGARTIRCGCFGARQRSTALVLVRAIAFTALAGFAAFADRLGLGDPSRDSLVLAVLVILAVAVVALGVLVLALYRQVGVLSLRIGPQAPLELEEEGPAVGAPAPALRGLERRGGELVAFFSEDCRLCRELAPAVRALGREGLAVRVAYEAVETDAFRRWNVPGTPFVVHVVDGVVAAKGLVNTLEQLDALVAVGTARTEHAAA